MCGLNPISSHLHHDICGQTVWGGFDNRVHVMSAPTNMKACLLRAEEEILKVAGYSMKTAALTGPPRPSVYCLRKSLVDGSRALLLKMSSLTGWGRSGLREAGDSETESVRCRWRSVCEERRMTLEVGGLVVDRAKSAHGSHGLRMDPSRPPPRCQCYDMCTALLFSLTTRALHLPGWPGLIKKAWFTCWRSDRPPSPLPVALTLHFLWAGARPSRVINNHRMEWGKAEFPIRSTPKRGEPFTLAFFFGFLNIIMVSAVHGRLM